MITTEESQEKKRRVAKSEEEHEGEVCGDITDPLRRGLCKVCNMPVVGEAPFCKDHEPPVP
jgi:hypothetical protein